MKAKAVNLGEVARVRPAEVRIEIPADKISMANKIQGLGLGRKVTVEVTGRVCRANASDFESTLCLEISSLHVEPGMGGQVEQVRNRRRY